MTLTKMQCDFLMVASIGLKLQKKNYKNEKSYILL